MTNLNHRIDKLEYISKLLMKKRGLPEYIVGRQHLTTEQIDFLRDQSEEDFQEDYSKLEALLEAAE